MRRLPFLTKLLIILGVLGVMGLAGAWWLHRQALEDELRLAMAGQLSNQAQQVADRVESHLRVLAMHRRGEGLLVRRQLETLAQADLQLCDSLYQRQRKGQLSREQAQEQARQIMLGQTVGRTGYPFVWDVSRAPESVILAVHPKIQGSDVAYVDFVRLGSQMKRGYLEFRWANPGEDQVRDKSAAMEYFEPWQWVICISAYRDEFHLMVDQNFYHDAQKELLASLAAVTPMPGGQTFILDGDGQLVAGPQGPAPSPELLDRLRGLRPGTASLERAGRPWLAHVRMVAGLERLVLLAPEDEMVVPWTAGMGGWFLAGAGAWLLVLMAAAGYLWTMQVGKPLANLTRHALGMAEGVLERVPNSAESAGELAGLVESLDRLAQRYQDSLAYLAQSEKRYRDLFENAPDPGYVISAGGFVMEINQAMERLLGRQRHQVHGLHLSHMLEPGQERLVAQALEEAARRGQAQSGLRFTVLDQDGHPRQLEGFLAPLAETQGQLRGYFGLAQDLSEQSRLQEQLLQAQKMEIMGTLAGGIAHDFNNLLSSILGYSSLLLAQPGLDPRITRYLQIIDSSAGQAAALTQQLLSLGKSGRRGRQPVEINTVVSDVLTILDHSLRGRVEVQSRLAGDLPVVEADPGQLHQVLMNLCINARDAMPQGGILLLETYQAAESQAPGGPEQPGQGGVSVVISVSDTGQGMDEETQRRALEPFFTTKEQGTGLGLPMAQGIIDKHGGVLQIVSQPGRGTSVRVHLPPGRGGLSLASALEPMGLTGGNETVLVVDDEPGVRDLAVESLLLCGYRVLAAASGQEVMELLGGGQSQPDLMLLDLMMSGMSGLELLPRIKKLCPGIKVILVSGMYDTGQEGTTQWRQADAFMPKPYRVPAMLALVRQVLDQTQGPSPLSSNQIAANG